MQCVLTLHVSPFADTADSTGPHSVSRRSKLMVYIQGHQWSRTKTTHFLLSPDLIGFQRMPFPSAGPWVHTTLMTSTVVREKQELQQQSGEIIPEWPSAIVKDAGGEITPGPAGSATMDKNFIYWPRVQLYESSLYFFHAMPERLPFEILTSSQKRTRFRYTCSVSWTECPLPRPTTNLSRSYHCRETSIPSPHHLKLSSHWKRKTVGKILGLNCICPFPH